MADKDKVFVTVIVLVKILIASVASDYMQVTKVPQGTYMYVEVE